MMELSRGIFSAIWGILKMVIDLVRMALGKLE